jgi:hypothetical protein
MYDIFGGKRKQLRENDLQVLRDFVTIFMLMLDCRVIDL